MHREWTQEAGGGAVCPAPMTRAALLALRNAGSLKQECHYVVTNYNRANVGAAEILLHATGPDTLSMDAKVSTTHDNLSWQGRYDIDANRLVGLNDNIGNVVDGPDAVDSFPWGVPAASDNEIHEARVIYTAGAFTHNIIHSASTVRVGGATFRRNVIGQAANVTVSAGDFTENRVDSDATVNSSTSGDVDNNHFANLSVTNVSGTANLDASSVAKNGNLTVLGGNVGDTTIEEDAQATFRSGSNFENRIGTSSVYNQVGTGYLRYTTIEGTSTVTIGNTNVSNCRFKTTPINTTGSTGTISNSSIENCNLNACANVPSFTLQYANFDANSQVSVNGAARFYSRFCTMSGFGRMLVSAGRQLDINYTGLRDYSYVQVTNGRLYCNYCSFANVSYVQQASTGTNRCERSQATTQSRIRFLNTTNNCRVYYCRADTGGIIEHRGTSSGCYWYYCSCDSVSQMFSNNSVNLRGYYNKASGNSQIYSQNVTGTHYMYYNACNGHGYIWFLNSTGGRIYAISCHGQGLLRFIGATAAGRIYYSSFTAYYYLYANNWTVTRFALHGHGRRTYNVTNPATNGAFVQNF